MVRLSTNTSGQRYPRSLTTQNATVVVGIKSFLSMYLALGGFAALYMVGARLFLKKQDT
ncbi:hypothetical protein [Acetobacter ascendens]|uniref:hypothetical protein n=1 Tax=Acetobacter ascendens TaxID=481146 RepID=UPI0012FFCFD1|nr:hypothetical protein [Acetobacter ascendens]